MLDKLDMPVTRRVRCTSILLYFYTQRMLTSMTILNKADYRSRLPAQTSPCCIRVLQDHTDRRELSNSSNISRQVGAARMVTRGLEARTFNIVLWMNATVIGSRTDKRAYGPNCLQCCQRWDHGEALLLKTRNVRPMHESERSRDASNQTNELRDARSVPFLDPFTAREGLALCRRDSYMWSEYRAFRN